MHLCSHTSRCCLLLKFYTHQETVEFISIIQVKGQQVCALLLFIDFAHSTELAHIASCYCVERFWLNRCFTDGLHKKFADIPLELALHLSVQNVDSAIHSMKKPKNYMKSGIPLDILQLYTYSYLQTIPCRNLYTSLHCSGSLVDRSAPLL